jgi:hypothetical protein
VGGSGCKSCDHHTIKAGCSCFLRQSSPAVEDLPFVESKFRERTQSGNLNAWQRDHGSMQEPRRRILFRWSLRSLCSKQRTTDLQTRCSHLCSGAETDSDNLPLLSATSRYEVVEVCCSSLYPLEDLHSGERP